MADYRAALYKVGVPTRDGVIFTAKGLRAAAASHPDLEFDEGDMTLYATAEIAEGDITLEAVLPQPIGVSTSGSSKVESQRKPFDPVLFGQAVRAYRSNRTSEEICKQTGLVLATLKEVEEGNIHDIEVFAVLCKWMGTTADAWLGLMDDEMPPENIRTANRLLLEVTHLLHLNNEMHNQVFERCEHPVCASVVEHLEIRSTLGTLDEFRNHVGGMLPDLMAKNFGIPEQHETLAAGDPETTLIDGSPVTDDHREIDPETGLQKGYVVLSDEERAKGFVRPVRDSYVHVGALPKYPLRDLTDEEKERYPDNGYVKFEEYPKERSPLTGRYRTEADLNSGCGSVTTMARQLAEIYARDPKFYGATMCRACKAHFPVGESGQFVWDGTNERVGT